MTDPFDFVECRLCGWCFQPASYDQCPGCEIKADCERLLVEAYYVLEACEDQITPLSNVDLICRIGKRIGREALRR
jgi:hypothetical protein